MKLMLDELKQTKDELCRFYSQEKRLRWFLAAVILIVWGIRIVYDDIFIDSEIMMTDPYGLLQSWYGSNRFGLVLTKKIFGMIRLIPFLSNIMFAIALWNLALLLSFAISRWKGRTYFAAGGKFLFCALLVTAPSLTEQYAFTLQAFEVTMGMIYCLIAVYCSGKLIYDRGSILWAFPAVGFMVWSFGSYQAFPAYYIALVIISFISQNGMKKGIYGWKSVFSHILLFLTGFVGYLLLAYLIRSLKGASSAYVDSMFLWQQLGVKACIENIYLEFQKIYQGKIPLFFPRSFGLCIIITVAFQIYYGVEHKIKNLILYVLAAVVLAFAPLYTSIITGMETPIRGQLVYSLMWAYYGSEVLEGFHYLAPKFLKEIKIRKLICQTMLAAGLFVAWRQGMNTTQLCYTLHDTYLRDTLTAERMYMDVCRVADREDMQNCKVAFVGMRDARLPGSAVRGEGIGRSYFNWGMTEIGVTNRVNSLFNLLGMNLESVSAKEYQLAVRACEDRESWPSSDSVFTVEGTDIVVVKLSE